MLASLLRDPFRADGFHSSIHRAMSHAETVSVVRLKAIEAFLQFRLRDGPEPTDSILLKGGIYCGRRFEVERGYAVWDAASDELRVFRHGGKLLTAIPHASQSSAASRAAA
jgi:hypothetical protein